MAAEFPAAGLDLIFQMRAVIIGISSQVFQELSVHKPFLEHNCFLHNDRGSIPGRGQRFSLLHSVHTGSGAHPHNRHRGLFSWEEIGLGVKLIIHLQLQRSRMVELYLHSPIRLHGVVFN
jgi:hypothetical protein